MAESKKGFILYADLIHTVRKLPKDKAGDLFLTILEYVNDENPEPEDLLLSVTFEPIKQQLKRDLDKWRTNKGDRSLNGRMGNLKRWNPDLHEKVEQEAITLEEAEKIAYDRKTSPPDRPPIDTDRPRSPTIANIAVNANVNVNDTVSVTDKENNKPINPSFAEFGEKYFLMLKTKGLIKSSQKVNESWNDHIRKLVEIDKISIEELKAVCNVYADNIEDEFAPQAYSTKSLRDKYIQIKKFASKKYNERSN